ncbi:MAG: hypothetical protein DCC55_16375, partial [Chloroflexi bacterium]
MYKMKGIAKLIGLLLLAASFIPQPALAHATLVRSDPADGSLLDAAPSQVQLWFNEAVHSRFSLVRMLDANGQPVAIAAGRGESAERNILRAPLPELAPGTYVALWKVLSEVDGHWSQGVVIFSVGVETPHAMQAGSATATGL